MAKKYKVILINTFLIIVSLIMIFPMLWMLLLSLKKYPESFKNIIDLVFSEFTVSNFTDAFSSDTFPRYFLNSIFVSASVTLGNVVFCLLAAYVLVRKEFRIKGLIVLSILGVLLIPPHVIMIPLYRLMVNFNWLNKYYALIIPWLVTPFGIFLLRQYLLTLPPDMEDAAKIDGAGSFYILFRIVAPLCKPILIVLAIYTFLSNWNTFLFPFLFTNSEDMRTLPVGLTFYLGKQSIDWGHLMAGAAIAALPILILFIVFQKHIIKGLTAGALKE